VPKPIAVTERDYNKLRKEALRAARKAYEEAGKENIRATSISPEALKACKAWNNSLDRRVDWDWSSLYTEFKNEHPKRFEIALWKGCQLIGLSLGKPSYCASNLRLELVEASPPDLGDRPSIMNLVLLAYVIYAHMINATEIRIMNPINDYVIKHYEKYGYTYVSSGSYLYKKVPKIK